MGDDDCKTVKTSVCKTLPGSSDASIEWNFNYRNCCNDNFGSLHSIGSSVLEPTTCSARKCSYVSSIPHTIWKSQQIISGCDCCVLNGNLVQDGYQWWSNGFSFECCRGEIVRKVNETIPKTTI